MEFQCFANPVYGKNDHFCIWEIYMLTGTDSKFCWSSKAPSSIISANCMRHQCPARVKCAQFSRWMTAFALCTCDMSRTTKQWQEDGISKLALATWWLPALRCSSCILHFVVTMRSVLSLLINMEWFKIESENDIVIKRRPLERYLFPSLNDCKTVTGFGLKTFFTILLIRNMVVRKQACSEGRGRTGWKEAVD